MLFQSKTVDTVMSAFTKTIADLKEVSDRNKVNAANSERVAAQCLADAGACRVEAARADELAGCLEALVSA